MINHGLYPWLSLVKFSLKPESSPHIEIPVFETKLPLNWKHQRSISMREGKDSLHHPTQFLAQNKICPQFSSLRVGLALFLKPRRWAFLSLRGHSFYILIVFTVRKLFLRACPILLSLAFSNGSELWKSFKSSWSEKM